jgi:hypothetical protein
MVCDSCRQRAGSLIAVRSESRSVGDWYRPLPPKATLSVSSRIVWAGTPDLSGRTLNCAGPLPHECAVPPQCPVTSLQKWLEHPSFEGCKIEMHKIVYANHSFAAESNTFRVQSDFSFKSPQKRCCRPFTANGPTNSQHTAQVWYAFCSI